MKKILLLLTVFTMVFTSCDPLEDINAEVDAIDNPIVGDVVFTMTEDDYKVVNKSFNNFDDEEEAKELIPTLLNDKYPAWGNKSSATVTFKRYNKKNDEKSLIVYTVQNSDYGNAGLSYSSISSDSQMNQLLNYLYPTPEDRVLISLTYAKYDSGITTTVENGFIYSNGNWEESMGITLDEYKAMGESREQFSNEDEALVKIPIFLKNKLAYEGPTSGDIQGVMYKLYVTDYQDIDGDGRTNDSAVYSFVVFYTYDGIDWVKYDNNVNETIQFGHDGTTWVPDNTIKYTLVRNADYEYMASQLTGAEYASLIGNLAGYGDFDYNWSSAQIEYALTLLLDHLDPDAAEGQKYILTYVIYDNGENDYQTSFIKTNGAWEVN
ncbi:hypothetical protein [Polaribacter sp.]|uniref:hypothetical protein n=1 Tax=Polaribacter sp. TaxID=1920175 RepID=UPI003EFA90D2